MSTHAWQGIQEDASSTASSASKDSKVHANLPFKQWLSPNGQWRVRPMRYIPRLQLCDAGRDTSACLQQDPKAGNFRLPSVHVWRRDDELAAVARVQAQAFYEATAFAPLDPLLYYIFQVGHPCKHVDAHSLSPVTAHIEHL